MKHKMKTTALGIAASSILMTSLIATPANAKTDVIIKPHGIGMFSVDVISDDKKSWTTVEEKNLFLPVTVGMGRDGEDIMFFKIRQGHLSQNNNEGWLYQNNFSTATTRPSRFDDNLIISGSTANFSASDRTKIIKGCNKALLNGGNIHKSHHFFYSVPMQMFTAFTENVGPKTNQNQYAGAYGIGESIVRVECKGVRGSAGDLVAEEPTFKLKDIKLFLTTYTGNESRPDQFHKCKRARILMRGITTKAGPVKLRLKTKFDDGPFNEETFDAWSSFDGNTAYHAEIEKWVTVEKTSHLYAIVEDPAGKVYGESKGVTIRCETIGSGDDFASVPTGADEPLVQPAQVTGRIVLNPKTNTDASGMHYGKVAIRLESSKSGDTKYKLTCDDGLNPRVWSGSLPTVRNAAGKYVATKLHGFRFNKTTVMGCALRSISMIDDPVIAIATHKYEVHKKNPNVASDNKTTPAARPRPSKPKEVAKKPAKAAEQAVKLLNNIVKAQKGKAKNKRPKTTKKKLKIFAIPGAKKR